MTRIMSSSLVVCLLLAARSGADPPALRPDPIPVLPDTEASFRAILEACRSHRAFLKEEIAWKENMLADLKDVLTPELRGQILKYLEHDRERLKREDKLVQALEQYDRQRKLHSGSASEDVAFEQLRHMLDELWGPPPAVAPMPREVKR